MMLCFLFSALIVILDQFFKQWIVRTIALGDTGPDLIPGILGLTRWENDGAMLNILSGQQWLLAGIALIAAVILGFILVRYNEGFWGTLGLAAVLGGTVGNLMDRVFNDGKVIDMFRTLFINFPIFNIADIFITLGFITFLVHFIAITFKNDDAQQAAKQQAVTDYEDEADAYESSEDDVLELDDIKNIYSTVTDESSIEQPAQVQAQEYEHEETPEEYEQATVAYTEPISEPEYTETVTPDISLTMEALELDLDSIDVDYDVDELLREYGIEDD